MHGQPRERNERMTHYSETVSDKVVAISGAGVVDHAAAYAIGQCGGVDVGGVIVRRDLQRRWAR